MMVLRHLLSIMALPFVMTVLIPAWIARTDGIRLGVAATPGAIAVQLAGAVTLAIGLTLFVASLRRFASEGKGTLAPWDPPRQLVASGPYRYVRNPMISGVIFMLFGEALILMSRSHAIWAVTFMILNMIQIPIMEEPMLAARFGDSYTEYCRHVPRLFPRFRPWNSGRT